MSGRLSTYIQLLNQRKHESKKLIVLNAIWQSTENSALLNQYMCYNTQLLLRFTTNCLLCNLNEFLLMGTK